MEASRRERIGPAAGLASRLSMKAPPAAIVLLFASTSIGSAAAARMVVEGSVRPQVSHAAEFLASRVGSSGDPGEWGAVSFPISCRSEVQGAFDRAVAVLHSFEFAEAARAFEAIAATDPNCGMAYWGKAASEARVVWGPAWIDFESGAESIRRAVEVGGGTPRENAYIGALASLFEGWRERDYQTRVRRFADAMAEVHGRYPDDTEAALFHGLALLGTVDPMDISYRTQREAGRIFEAVFEEQPDHPGAAHYIIHAYDYPPLARLALPAARRYAEVAPSAAHALHMPSHIFSRLGLWRESIETNRAAKAAAERSEGWTEVAHTLDYMIYAHLQLGDSEVAPRLAQELIALAGRHPDEYGVLEHLADVEARLLLEGRNWSDFATLDLEPGLDRYPRFEATVRFARALGAARSGHPSEARREVEKLAALRGELLAADESYYAASVAIWRQVAEAWIARAEGEDDKALEGLRRAAALDDQTAYVGGFESGPDALVQTREQLGDLLLALGRPAEALREYQAALDVSPNRLHGLFGAGRAAELAGDARVAEANYRRLLEVTEGAEDDDARLQIARDFLQAH